jgi:CheY-like chemotaxis protein
MVTELSSEGYSAIAFEKTDDAYEYILQNTPDLIVSDIKLVPMNGFEFLKVLKDNPDTVDIPFIFVTGNADLKTAIESRRLGAEDFVSKPYDLVDLLNTIERILFDTENLAQPHPVILSNSIIFKELHFLEWKYFIGVFHRAMEETGQHMSFMDKPVNGFTDFTIDYYWKKIYCRLLKPDRNNLSIAAEIDALYSCIDFQIYDGGLLAGLYEADKPLYSYASQHKIELVGSERLYKLIQSII